MLHLRYTYVTLLLHLWRTCLALLATVVDHRVEEFLIVVLVPVLVSVERIDEFAVPMPAELPPGREIINDRLGHVPCRRADALRAGPVRPSDSSVLAEVAGHHTTSHPTGT